MSAAFKSIPNDNAFDALRNSHGVILTEFCVSRLSTALQGIHAITAVLQQRELDAETGNGEGVTFGPTVAMGLISALATCAEFVENAIETGGASGERALHGTPAYDHLRTACFDVMQAKREEVRHE